MTPKEIYIRDVGEGQILSDVFALSQAQRKEAKNGPYWQLTLLDRTGSMEARVWFPLSQQFSILRAGDFVVVSGQAASFKDQLQLNISEMTVVEPEQAGLNMADFLPSSAVPPEKILEEIEVLLAANLTFKPWSKLCKSVLRDETMRSRLLSAPGAKGIHHAYAGGLLEHTLGIMRTCHALAELYPAVDKEILLVGALFHDMGKAFELTHGISRDYTTEGRLLGHIHLGLEILDPFLRKAKDLPQELILHLKHLLISHHGELEFGSPRRPKTVEAFILHYADNLDAKVNTVQAALAALNDEAVEGWSDYQRSLSRYVFRPLRTPRLTPPAQVAGKSTPKTEEPPLLKFMSMSMGEGNGDS